MYLSRSKTSAALLSLLRCYFGIFNIITPLYYYYFFLLLRCAKILLLIGSSTCFSNVGGSVAEIEERQQRCQTSAVV